jgi:hypothetical protein
VSCSGGTTVNFEASPDNATFFVTYGEQLGGTTIASSVAPSGTTTTVWRVPMGATQFFRARISGYSAGTVNVAAYVTTSAGYALTTNSNVITMPATAATSTKQSDGTQKTQIVDGSGSVIASTSNNLNVQCANCSGSGASAVDNATATESTSVFAPIGAEFQTTPGTVTTGHQAMLAMTSKRGLQVSLFDASGNALLGSKTSANSVPVVVASDQGALTVSQATGTNLHIVCDSGCSSSAGFADNSAFTFGTTAINPIGGVLDDTSTNVATENSAAIARITPQKAVHINLRNQAGTEIGTSSTPVQVSLANTAANATAVKVDGSAVTQPVSGTVTTSPPANASTNVAQLAGTATSVNSGTKDAGTLRVVLATDQPALTNKLLVTPDSVALPANQSVNVSQVNGITTLTGTGATGTGAQRVTVAVDSATVAGSASLPAGTNVIGHVIEDSGSTTAATQATASNLNAQVQGPAASGAAKSGNPLQVGGVFNTTPPTVTTGQVVEAQYTTRGAAIVATGLDAFTVAGTVTTTPPANASTNVAQFGGSTVTLGQQLAASSIPVILPAATVTALTPLTSVTANQGTANATPWNDNVAQFGGSAVVTGTGAGGAGIPRVTVSSDSTVTANAGTNLNTSALALEATQVSGNTTLSAIENDLRGVNAGQDTTLLAILRAILQQGTPKTAAGLKGSFGRLVTSTQDALDVNVKFPIAQADPCAGLKSSTAISQTGNTRIVAGSAGRIYLCSVLVVGADAENISFVEGTGATCATGTAAVIGGTTAATGPNLAANGGFTMGSGGGAVAITATPGTDLCLFQSGAGRVAGNVTYAIR